MTTQDFTIEFESRTGCGKAEVNRIRQNNLIPGVVYAGGEKAIPVTMPYFKFYNLAKHATSTQVFNVKSNDKAIDGKSVLVKEIQQDYLEGKVLHVDFLLLAEGRKVRVRVPIHVTGESPGVKNDGGVLSIARHEIELDSLPKAIPHFLEVDISSLNIGDSIHARELKLPEGAELPKGLLDETVVSVVMTKTQIVETPVAAEAVEGAAVEGEAAAGEATDAAAKAAPEKGEKK